MIFPASPYYPFLGRLRRLIADSENATPAIQLAALDNTGTGVIPALTATIAYNAMAATQTMVITDGTNILSVDLTAYISIVDLIAYLTGRVVGNAIIQAWYFPHPIRNNMPTDLLPGVYKLSPAPTKIMSRHIIADEELVDDLQAAVIEHNPAYTLDPTQVTATIVDVNGLTTYPWPAENAYPYPSLKTDYIIYMAPPNEQYFITLLCAANTLNYIAQRYARLPTVMTDGITVDRAGVSAQIRLESDAYRNQYEEAYRKNGLGFQISDLTRISGTLGVLTLAPEYPGSPSLAESVYGMRYLSNTIPNLVQPCTTQDANPYDTTIGGMFDSPGVFPYP
jgi:hypothetical protein